MRTAAELRPHKVCIFRLRNARESEIQAARRHTSAESADVRSHWDAKDTRETGRFTKPELDGVAAGISLCDS